MISIFALIYKSVTFLESVYDSIQETVNLKEVEFFFLANNATDEVLDHLNRHGLPHYVRKEPIMSKAEREAAGVDTALDYISDVYLGWNEAFRRATGEVAIPVNSDHVFAPGWLDALMGQWRPGLAVSPVMFEPRVDHFPDRINGTGSIVVDCGSTPRRFDHKAFHSAIRGRCERGKVTAGGVYMPCAIHRQAAIDAGLYPPGNVKRPNRPVGFPGDQVFFERLRNVGIEHQTCWTSFCYHFMEGEMKD